MNWIELIGIAGSLLVLISFLMKDILVIRIINISGSVVFIIYGIMIGAMATWFVNAALIVVHVVYIIKELKDKKKKKAMSVNAVEQTDISKEDD